MKKIALFTLAALVAALALPLTATAQLAKPKKQRAETGEAQPKYEVFAGFAATSLNQVNASRSALGGVKIGATRDWGRYFGLTAEGSYYKLALTATNPYPVIVTTFLGGPALHADLYGKVGIDIHGLIGVEHTGNTQQTPDYSFAGGLGGGLSYKLSRHLFIRAFGDVVGASFTLTGNTSALGYSPHRSWNPQTGIGVAYKF